MEQTTEFTIAPDVFEAFPKMTVLGLRAWIDMQTALGPANDRLAAEMPAVIQALESIDPLSQLPEIAAWRAAYGKLGVKPSKYPSSVEALLKRAKKGEVAETGIPAVDLYNRISIKNRVPLGAYDAAKLRPGESLQLRHAVPRSDAFSPLGGRPESFPLNPSLIVYAQGAEILCWGFNSRDSSVSAVDERSSEILFFSETLIEDDAARSRAALEEIADLFRAHGGKASKVAAFSARDPGGRL